MLALDGTVRCGAAAARQAAACGGVSGRCAPRVGLEWGSAASAAMVRRPDGTLVSPAAAIQAMKVRDFAYY